MALLSQIFFFGRVKSQNRVMSFPTLIQNIHFACYITVEVIKFKKIYIWSPPYLLYVM